MGYLIAVEPGLAHSFKGENRPIPAVGLILYNSLTAN